jgi:putative ABC transport system permease protein
MNWKRVLRIERPVDRQATEDVKAEIEFHLQARTDELQAAGLPADEARRQAKREFGDMRAARAALVPPARRAERRRRVGRWVDELARDTREAARGLRSAPAFTLVAVATLAIAIGSSTGIFSVANAVLFRPLPYAQPDRIVQVNESEEPESPRDHISSATYIDWRNEAQSFSEFGAYGVQLPLVMVGPDMRPRQVESTLMTPAAFRALGVSPVVGRAFREEEGVPGSPRVVIISWAFWQTHFGGDEGAVGSLVTLDDQDYEIVGVMGPRFAFPDHDVEVWPTLRFTATSDGQNRRAHQWSAIGRLAPGISAETAEAELDAISARLEMEFPADMTNWRARVRTFRADLTRTVRPLVWVLLGVVVTVLLVACANLANLMLARFTSSRREMAMRSALGAGRGRLIRRVLVETGVLALLGGGLGLVLAVALMRVFVSIAPADIPLLAATRLDGTVLAFASVATVASLTLFGLIPAFRSTKVDPALALRDSGRGSSGGRSQTRLRSTILVSQIAMSSLLLIGAGLLVRTMDRLQSLDLGYEIDGVVAATLRLPPAAYPTSADQVVFFETLREGLLGIPGVDAVAATSEPPVVGYQMSFGYAVQGQPRSGPQPMEQAIQLRAVTPPYFELLRQPLIAGRTFEETDVPGAPRVAIINESMARLHWPAGDAVGQRISTESPQGEWVDIVGVVADTYHRGALEPEPAFYVPWDQKAWDWLTWQTFMIRTSVPPAALRGAIDEAVWAVDRSLALERLVRVSDLYADSRASNRFAMQLLVSFAVVAMLLGAIGLYGVLAYSVGLRRREIGVRMALGAASPSIAGMVVKDGIRLSLLGLAIGLAAAAAGTRFLDSLLYGVGSLDPVTFLAIPVLLLGVTAFASWLPARRAAGTDPATVLRDG